MTISNECRRSSAACITCVMVSLTAACISACGPRDSHGAQPSPWAVKASQNNETAASLVEQVLGVELDEFKGKTFRGYTLGEKFDPADMVQLPPNPFSSGDFFFAVKAKDEEGRRPAIQTWVIVDAESQRIVGISAAFAGDRETLLEDVISLFGKTPEPIESYSVDGGAGKEGINVIKWTFPKSIARVVLTDFTPVRVCIFDREYVEAALGAYAQALMTAADWLAQVSIAADRSPEVVSVIDKDRIARQVSEMQERYQESQQMLTMQQQYEVAYLFGLDREASAQAALVSPDTPDEEREKAKKYLDGRRAANGAEQDKKNARVTDPSQVSSNARAHYALQVEVEALRAMRDVAARSKTRGGGWGSDWPLLADAKREAVLREGVALYADQQSREKAVRQSSAGNSAVVPMCHVAAVWVEGNGLLAVVDLHASTTLGLQKLRVSNPEAKDWAGNTPTIASTECKDLFVALGSSVFQRSFPPAGESISVVSYAPRHSFARGTVSPDLWDGDGRISDPRHVLARLHSQVAGRRHEWECADGSTIVCGAAGTFALAKPIKPLPVPRRGL